MSAENMRSLIDELGAAAMECRSLLADVRTATKDLRLAVREAHDARDELADAVSKMVKADVDKAVGQQVEKLGDATEKAMAAAVEKVGKEFDKLSNLYLTGDLRGRPGKGLDLRKLAGGA